MLSGGVDSSAIAVLANSHCPRGIGTFTVGFGEGYARDEVSYAREFSSAIGAHHHSVMLNETDYLSALEDCVGCLEEPVATASIVAFRAVCKLAREHVKVVLTGQGADEPFAGYPRYLGLRYAGLFRAVPAWLRARAIEPAVVRLPRNERLKRAVRSLAEGGYSETLASVYSVIDDDTKRRLLLSGVSDDAGEAEIAYWLRRRDNASLLDAALYADARLSLPDSLLLYGDKMSMAASLEARVPFLDTDLMAIAESIPGEWKIRGRDLKHLWKTALAEWVPRNIRSRPKIGFEAPVDEWFRRGLKDGLAASIQSEESGCAQYLNRTEITRLLEEHRTGRHDHKRILFALLVFDVWHRLFIASDAGLRQ
jgi:asparagine synthase (glutamine-hydrolysing)